MNRLPKFRVWNPRVKNWDDGVWMYQSGRLDHDTMMRYHLDECCVQQFTGFTDKNRKDIYEGDIVRYCLAKDFTESFQVVWDDFYGGGFAFAGSDGKGLNHTGVKFINNKFHGNDNYEVIGNIFENPELLEKV